ncbi:hypothetical protein EV210_101135 [Anaerospora hongkongensis]|uniref:Uncharacterized protein n=1 Tax=Anaerospora hongkongensis TaxID=244830 RepID=A0A4R1Q298_9FIRM|nr:hypothetical protein [Anaerospora hongkongensis]TCL39937.1 hypothetical protein EV210_101135 [Anaerospora hongkongensis]
MRKKILVPIITLILSLMLNSVVFAKANHWKDNSFDFSSIQKIVIMTYSFDQDILDPFASQKTSEYIAAEIAKQDVQFLTLDQVIKQIGQDLNIDMAAIKKQNPNQFFDIIATNISKYADAGIKINVYQMGWVKQYIPPSSFNYTSYNTSYINGYNSKGTNFSAFVQTPQTNQVTIPGGFEDFATASMAISVYDLKDIKLIWGYSDYKSDQSRAFKKASPEQSMKKLTEDAFKTLPVKKIKK